MTVRFTKEFKSQYKKLPQKVQQQFTERLRLFKSNRSLPELRIHELKGTMFGYWSMNVNYRYSQSVVLKKVIKKGPPRLCFQLRRGGSITHNRLHAIASEVIIPSPESS